MFRDLHISLTILVLAGFFFLARINAQEWEEGFDLNLNESVGCEECCEEQDIPSVFNRQRIYVGPEIYHVKRLREGGTRQGGWLYGVRAGYDRVKRCCLYWGIDGLYAKGTLRGKTGKGDKVKSRFMDGNVEGRIGYTFQKKNWMHISFTPFLGMGYYSERNHFKNPSPLPIHFHTRFTYGVIGFLSNFPWNQRFEVGLNFRARYPFEPRCRVSNDPDNESVNLNVKERWQFRAELPLTYNCTCDDRFALTFSPFYEYQHYGRHLNYPSNFLKTQYQFWGATLEFVYRI